MYLLFMYIQIMSILIFRPLRALLEMVQNSIQNLQFEAYVVQAAVYTEVAS
jgi:hypothetical protein